MYDANLPSSREGSILSFNREGTLNAMMHSSLTD